jgi:hypothetical protein
MVASSCVQDESHDSDCCPVTTRPDATLSERSFFPQAQDSDQESTAVTPESVLRLLDPLPATRFAQYPSSDPPFDRLLGLRV